MAILTWNSASGAFDVGSNWTPAGPPASGDTALFDASSGTISETGTVAALDLIGAGPWIWTRTVTASNHILNATVTLSTGAVWTLSGTPTGGNDMVIGSGSTAGVTAAGGAGTLTILNGARVLSGANQSDGETALALGVFASDVGILTISGSGSAGGACR